MAKVTFQNEEGQYLNRYKLTPVEGQMNVYDFERMASITKQGTSYSKEIMDHMLQVEDKGVPGGCAELDEKGKPVGALSSYDYGMTPTSTRLATHAGMYHCHAWEDIPYDAPDAQGTILVFPTSIDYPNSPPGDCYMQQIFVNPFSRKIWARVVTNGTYSNWNCINDITYYTGVDTRSITRTGRYRVLTPSANCPPLYTSDSDFFIDVFNLDENGSTGYIVQIFYDIRSLAVFEQHCINGTWYWKNIGPVIIPSTSAIPAGLPDGTVILRYTP